MRLGALEQRGAVVGVQPALQMGGRVESGDDAVLTGRSVGRALNVDAQVAREPGRGADDLRQDGLVLGLVTRLDATGDRSGDGAVGEGVQRGSGLMAR
jgi:hypothetical protein